MIETPRLLIRRFAPGDWRDLHEYLSDPAVVLFEPYDVLSELECQQEALRRSESSSFWAVCLKQGGKLIGNLYLQAEEFGTWELGYVFNARHQGHGYATESAAALMDHAFRVLGARRIVARCNPDNDRSWRLLERVGLRREAHQRQNVFFRRDQDGNPIWLDTYQYAILVSEWNARA